MDKNYFVFDSSYLNTNYGPTPAQEINDHKKNEASLTPKEWTEKDFELDIDFIIETKPKPPKVIEYFKKQAEVLNKEYFDL
jgi:hypothetical protein